MSKQKITVGVVGVSGRGQGLLESAICQRADVTVAAVCDLYADRAEAAADLVEKLDGKRPETTTDYHDILKMDSVDAVIIAAAWEAHIPVAVDAMRAGKIVGCVGAALGQLGVLTLGQRRAKGESQAKSDKKQRRILTV